MICASLLVILIAANRMVYVYLIFRKCVRAVGMV